MTLHLAVLCFLVGATCARLSWKMEDKNAQDWQGVLVGLAGLCASSLGIHLAISVARSWTDVPGISVLVVIAVVIACIVMAITGVICALMVFVPIDDD